MSLEALAYYRQPGLLTNLARHADRLQDLPDSIAGLCKLVQGVMIHVHWLESYGVNMPPEREWEVQIRSADRMLDRIWALDNRPLTVARPNDRQLFGNCRDHTTLLVALLRHQSIPARARCGFGTFFAPGNNADHWQCEVWQEERKRWVLVDAQLDGVQQEALKVTFDPTDIPPGNFITGGEAWQLCRAGRADPTTFGILKWWGMRFILGNTLRDLAALNKVELLPWDCWGLMGDSIGPDDHISEEDAALVDQVAQVIALGDRAFAEMRACYEGNPLLRVPEAVDTWYEDTLKREVVAGS